MGAYSGIGEAIAGLYIFACVSFFLAWPLALWKLWDIGVWFFAHIHWVTP